MSDPNPDGDVEDASGPSPGPASGQSASTGGETAGTGTTAGHGEETAETGTTATDAAPEQSVAEKAGIDDAVVGTPRKLDQKVRYRWVVGSSVGGVVLGVVAGVLTFLFGRDASALGGGRSLAVAVGAAVFGFVFLVAVLRAVLLYRSWEYVVREDSLYLSRGVLTRVRTVAPYVRVQHVDTQRSPVERLLGLSTLVVYTAGSRGADVTIPGLTPDGATDLQERLKRLAIESEEEDAV